ncbi:MAG: isoprenoid biosynthesis glyoxalase ElbB, partial [Candidatus Omnitrophica bacterium]|nr:isoprenoid biosynthesis glyoxalase ElbB [Candidatus Omnitrophota bacterium]
MTPKRFAIILAGCGNKDGAEIHESVLTLLAIDKAGHQYQCFAPDVPQRRALNFLTDEELKEKRNVLAESARIARSKIKPLSQYKQEDFDALVLPGGSGVAYNLCTFATDGANMTVNPDVERAVTTTHKAGKPIGALCISPVIIGKLIPKAELTFGQDEKINAVFQKLGVKTINTSPQDIVIDRANKVVSTPCYMHANARISELAQGIEKLIQA